MRSIVIAGVGGQGVLTASDLLSDVLLEADFKVKKSEVHGMSQRGGDVISTINFGDEVFSPLPSVKNTDYIMTFEKLEALRNVNYLKDNGVMMVNDFIWEPLPVASGAEQYPENIEQTLKKYTPNLIMIPATKIAKEIGNTKATNVVLLGVLASKMDIDINIWETVIKKKVPPKFIELNMTAFEKGYSFQK